MQQPDQRRPAIVPAGYPNQRYFHNTQARRVLSYMPGGSTGEVEVFRIAEHSTAQLCIELAGGHLRARVSLSAEALRLLASDLLDAAQDLEDHPPPHMVFKAPQGVLTFVNGGEVGA